jgi:bacillithiol system protein YtxJ
VAERTGVAHESPQVICFVGGKAVSHASHYDITLAELKRMPPLARARIHPPRA